MTKKLVIDLDNTLSFKAPGGRYEDAQPDHDLIEIIRAYRAAGFEIVIYTARNMRTHENNLGKITAKTVPVLLSWLERHDVPFDEIVVGKPWCGQEGFYVDDRAVRPSEFKSMTFEEICDLLAQEGMTAEGNRDP